MGRTSPPNLCKLAPVLDLQVIARGWALPTTQPTTSPRHQAEDKRRGMVGKPELEEARTFLEQIGMTP